MNTSGRRRRATTGALAVVLALVLGADVLPYPEDRAATSAHGASGGAHEGWGPAGATSPQGDPSGTGRQGDSSTAASAQQVSAVDALLRRQAVALRRQDGRTLRETVSSPTSLRARTELAAYAVMEKMGVTALRWHVTTLAPAPGASGRWVATVSGRYRLRRADTRTRSFTRLVEVDHRGGRWRVVGRWREHAPPGTEVPPLEPWDLAGAHVVRGRSSLVVGDLPSSVLRGYATKADEAARVVTGLCGADRPTLVVVAPSSVRGLRSLLGPGTAVDPSQVAAVTVSRAGAGAPAGGERIVVNPRAFAGLTTMGQQVVLTHEATHVALGRDVDGHPARWLSEGLADVVGYGESTLPETRIAADLLARVRVGDGPRTLPGDSSFDAATTRIALSYQAAYLAVRLAQREYGRSGVCRLYREAARRDVSAARTGSAGADAAEVATTAAWPAALRRSEAGFTRSWLSYLARLAGT